jgi:hypothetical protein
VSSPAPILAFCHLGKTGGVAFNQILRRRFGGRHLDAIVRFRPGTRRNQQFYTKQDLERDLWIYPRLRSIAGHWLSPAVDYGAIDSRFRWVTMLRDPSRRYVSHYAHQVEKMGVVADFETWMTNDHMHNEQVKRIAGSQDADRAKQLLEARCVVGLFEHYDQTMEVFERSLPELGLRIGHVPKVNSSRGQVDTRALAEKYASEIRKNNQLDQELYEYVRDVLWPRQLLALTRHTVAGAASPRGGSGRETGRSRLAWARVKRNLVYKPFVRLNQP